MGGVKAERAESYRRLAGVSHTFLSSSHLTPKEISLVYSTSHLTPTPEGHLHTSHPAPSGVCECPQSAVVYCTRVVA